MEHPALPPPHRAIAALTYNEIEVIPTDSGVPICNEQVPLLDRSIANDLMRIDSAISGKGQTLLSAIAHSIDEALVAIAEARLLLQGKDEGDA